MPTDGTKNTKIKTVILALPIGSNKNKNPRYSCYPLAKEIKSTDFTDFTDVAKQKFVIFVLSVGKKKSV